MLDPKKKARIIQKFGVHPNDTGSSQVQVAILTEEIRELQDHLRSHRHDFSSRRGLIRKVNQRRKLLRYLATEDFAAFEKIADILKIKSARKIVEKQKHDAALFEEDLKAEEAEAETSEDAHEEKSEE